MLNPAFYRANATFYVHTFPTGFIEYGHPPKPPIDESTTLIPKIIKNLPKVVAVNIF